MALEVTIMPLCFDSDETPKTIRYDKNEITLGRAPTNDIVLNRAEVSGHHAKVRLVEQPSENRRALMISDLGSLNGTIVENLSLIPHEEICMDDGARIIVGAYLIKPKIVGGALAKEIELLRDEKPRGPLEMLAARFRKPSSEEGLSSLSASSPDSELQPALEGHSVSDTLHMPQPLLPPHSAIGSVVTRPPRPEPQPIRAIKSSTVTARIRQSPLKSMDFTATRVFTVSGRVTHNGSPLAGVAINGGGLGETLTGDDGTFSFHDIEEGTSFTLTPAKPGYSFRISGLAGG